MVRLVALDNRSATVDFRTRSLCFYPRIIQQFLIRFYRTELRPINGPEAW